MRLLLVTDQYPPEICSAAGLMQELAEALAARSHDVTVLTTSPRYKLDRNDAEKTWPAFSVENAVSVVRVPTFALHHVGYLRRGLATVLAPFQLWRGLRRHTATDFDTVFIYSPPITLGMIGLLMRRRGASVVLNVQDIFPQNAIDLGILRNPLLITFFRWLEKLSYKHADIITAHSKGNLDLLKSTHPDLAGKFRVLHNWIDICRFSAPQKKDYRQLFSLNGKFVVLFAGVIGPAQGVHMLVEVADRVRDLDDLVFLVVGDGTEKQRAEDLARSRGLGNILFKPFISQDDYPDLLSSSEIGLICLSPDVKTPVVPGKVLGYMAASLPIAAFVNAESDVHQLVADAECGASCVSNDVTKMEHILRQFHANPEAYRQRGHNGRKYVVEHFSMDRIVAEIERMMEEIRPSRRK